MALTSLGTLDKDVRWRSEGAEGPPVPSMPWQVAQPFFSNRVLPTAGCGGTEVENLRAASIRPQRKAKTSTSRDAHAATIHRANWRRVFMRGPHRLSNPGSCDTAYRAKFPRVPLLWSDCRDRSGWRAQSPIAPFHPAPGVRVRWPFPRFAP